MAQELNIKLLKADIEGVIGEKKPDIKQQELDILVSGKSNIQKILKSRQQMPLPVKLSLVTGLTYLVVLLILCLVDFVVSFKNLKDIETSYNFWKTSLD